jgi:hypothetical protein
MGFPAKFKANIPVKGQVRKSRSDAGIANQLERGAIARLPHSDSWNVTQHE